MAFANYQSKSNTDIQRISEHVDRYECALLQNPNEKLEVYLPPEGSPIFSSVLAELARVQLEWAWNLGDEDALEDLIRCYPLISQDVKILSEVAYEDFRLRRSYGRPLNPQHYRDAYQVDTRHWPTDWETDGFDSLQFSSEQGFPGSAGIGATLSAQHGSTDPMGPSAKSLERLRPTVFPEMGDHIGGFDIIRSLGHGTFSRVYLARQPDLAQRLVVLKVTATPMGESQRLALLQHSNIMPLHSVHRLDSFFGLCMPFLGATTLKELLCQIYHKSNDHGPPNSGSVIADFTQRSIDNCGLDASLTSGLLQGSPGWVRNNYVHLSYVDAVFTIGLRLAEGLSHAHQRGVMHHDIKPANVLLAFDGEPLLMDFNLGRDFRNGSTPQRRIIGGTLPYMSPEHARAMWFPDEPLSPSADVYSLGVLLYELLTGSLPYQLEDSHRLDLDSLMEKLRQPVPDPARINSALPPSASAIIKKCMQPRELRYQTADELATDLRRYLKHIPNKYAANPSYTERVKKFSQRHTLLVSTTSMILTAATLLAAIGYWAVYNRHEKMSLQAIQTYQQFEQSLHLAEAELLFPDGVSPDTGLQRAEEALSVYSLSARELVDVLNMESFRNPMMRLLPAERKSRLRQQLGQLRTLVDSAQAWQVQPSKVTQSEARNSQRTLLDDPAEPFRNAVSFFLEGEFQKALEILEFELEASPTRFALWFVKGNCYFQMGRYREAEHAYAMASWCDQESALCHIKRAICHYQLRQDQAALEHLDRAQKLAPELAAIYSNRCLLLERQGKWDEALPQIQQAIALQPQCARFLMMRSRLNRQLDRPLEAKQDLQLIASIIPEHPDDWITKGIAVLPESAEQALDCFRRASVWPGASITARQNIAHVLSERLGRTEEAIEELDNLLSERPGYLPALAGRAVLHARLGNSELALRDVQDCMNLNPNPETHYQIACVYSLLSTQSPSLKSTALSHLAIALQPVYGHQAVATDDDLGPLKGDESFESMKLGIDSILKYASPSQNVSDAPE